MTRSASKGIMGWPQERFDSAPSLKRARLLAALAAPFGRGPGGRIYPERIASKLGIGIKLRSPDGDDGWRFTARLVPAEKTGASPFTIFCNPDTAFEGENIVKGRSAVSRETFRRVLVFLKIGHELGHTFFFKWDPSSNETCIPERASFYSRNSCEGIMEEVFCETFAAQLLREGRLSDTELYFIDMLHERYVQNIMNGLS